jgi:ABC-type lipoprotein export system ATPase subunit
MGTSGSGKSTLLNILGLIDIATSGSHTFDGFDVTGLPESRKAWLRGARIGYIFQAFYLYESRSVQQNVERGLDYLDLDHRGRRQRAGEALERVGISALSEQPARLLSGGERQRVAIARAIASRPALVLADEPTGNLDRTNTESILELLTELNSEGSTLIVVTHDPEVGGRAGRQLMVRDGRLLETTSTSHHA